MKRQSPSSIDLPTLRAELARRNKTQLDLARKLGHPVSTLTSWLRGAAPAPADLGRRIEVALGLNSGALKATGSRRPE